MSKSTTHTHTSQHSIIYKRRLKIIYKQEQIQAKLNDQLFQLPLMRKKQQQQNKMLTQYSGTRLSYLRHQQNFHYKGDQQPLMVIEPFQAATREPFPRRAAPQLFRECSLQPIRAELQHNFYLDQLADFEGWPENVRIVHNQIDFAEDSEADQPVKRMRAESVKCIETSRALRNSSATNRKHDPPEPTAANHFEWRQIQKTQTLEGGESDREAHSIKNRTQTSMSDRR